MTKAEVKEKVSAEVVRDIFEPFVVASNAEKWAITVSGRIIAVSGKMFYDTKQQAVKAFYNSFKWRALRSLWSQEHPDDPWGWWRSSDSKPLWEGFKEALAEKFGFKIVQV